MIKYLLFKYLRFDKSMPFIMITKLLAFFGVMAGVFVLIVSMAVMNGMNKSFMDKLLTMNYPISVYPKKKQITDELVAKLEKDFLLSPFIQTQAAIKSNNSLKGIVVFGVDFEREAKINKILSDALDTKYDKKFKLVIGENLFNNLSLDLFDKVSLMFTNMSPSSLSISPTIKRFDVISTFSSGLNAYDNTYTYTQIEDLQKILNTNTYSGIHIFSNDAFKDIDIIKNQFGNDYHIIGWWEQNGNFLSAMELEKKALFFILLMIVVIASLNIISSMFMLVLNRRNEIALLLALGASTKEIKNAFFAIGFIIGFIGIIFGILFGLLGVYVLDNFELISLPADVYGSSKLPVYLDILDFIYIVFGAIIIVALSSIYPAIKASKINILETLRNN